MAFGSRRISLIEYSCSSFCSCCFFVCVQVRMFLLLTMLMMAASGRSRLMRAGFPAGTCRRRSSDGAHSLLGWRVCAWCERNHFRKTLFYLLKLSFGFKLLYHNTWHSNCNNYLITEISWYCMLVCCVYAFSLHQESPDTILGDECRISEVVLS
jgi:hypothetical protein